MYEIELKHEGLNKYRHIKGNNKLVVEQKAVAQKKTWDEMWERKKRANKAKDDKYKSAKEKEAKIKFALEQTKEAERKLFSLERILSHALGVNNAIDWEVVITDSVFPVKTPCKPPSRKMPIEPTQKDAKYTPEMSFLEKMLPYLKRAKLEEANKLFYKDHLAWRKEKKKVERDIISSQEKYEREIKEWSLEKEDFLIKQKKIREKMLELKEAYSNMDSTAILSYSKMVLSNSKYPKEFSHDYDLEYNESTKLLVVDHALPNKENIPNLKSVKYIASRGEFKKTYISDAALNKLYDTLLYQIALRTLYELYDADVIDAIESVVFNGYVETIDKASGKTINPCIMTLSTSKDEFMAINLNKVEPKLCFRQLKGIASSTLHITTPVAPIVRMNKEDSRFVPHYDVVNYVDGKTNLAAMGWGDFENLIRELFEKEFKASGGEVKITQASRDGGVDAIAFDPDPIRGGKIIIQAKRYTNTVGVSAVRDLYGTLLNEGAMKGILVTTSDYGADSYKFAKDKPLELLNGGNLLNLLEKHGHRAKIDIKEAKKILSEENGQSSNLAIGLK